MADPLVEFDGVDKFFGDIHVLNDIDLSIEERDVVVVIGPSGSGKSTLLRCTNRLEGVESGDIRLDGRSVFAGDVNEIRQQVGMVFQSFNLFPHKDALGNVALGPRKIRGLSESAAEERARELLDRVGLGDQVGSYPEALSGGQKQRVAIARALAMEPKVMLFDEVTSALDPELSGRTRCDQGLAADGMTMVLVTHEMGFAREVGDRIVLMAEGQVIEESESTAFFERPETERGRQFLSRLLSATHD